MFVSRKDNTLTIALLKKDERLLKFGDMTIISALNASDEFLLNLLEFVIVNDEEVYLVDSGNYKIYVVKGFEYNSFEYFKKNLVATFNICEDSDLVVEKLLDMGVLNKLWQKKKKRKK